MQPTVHQHIKQPSRAQLGSPGDLLHWAREQFNEQVTLARISPQEAVQSIKDVLTALGLPPRVIVRCRVSSEALCDVAIDWQGFEARKQDEAPDRPAWYLYMPARPLEPLPRGIPNQVPTGTPP